MAKRGDPGAGEAYRSVLKEHRARFDRVSQRTAPAELKKLYDRGQQELASKLARLVRAGRGETFTAHQHRGLLLQARVGQAIIARQLAGRMDAVSDDVQTESLRGLVSDLRRLEYRFSGADIALPIEEASRFARAKSIGRPTLIRQHHDSFTRYGRVVTERIESGLASSLMTGETTHQAIDRVAEAADAEWWRAERIVRTECLPGDALVSGAMVRAGSRRWYEGPMAEIVTKRGRKLSATPNHPMLTRRGWIAASKLSQADDLICYIGDKSPSSSGGQDVAAPPTSIAQLFDTLSAVGVRKRRRGTQPDFHGDGRDGDIDVSYPDGELPVGVFAPLLQPLGDQIFAPSDLSNASFCPACGHLLPIDERCRGCDVPDRDIHFRQSFLDQALRYAEVAADAVRALAGFVSPDDLLVVHGLPFWMHAAGAIVEFDPGPREASNRASASEYLGNPRRANPRSLGHERNAESREIEFDHIASVGIRSFRGHVFNLESAHGYYTVNGVYTGNCAYAYNLTHAHGIQESSQELPDLYERWSEHATDTDPSEPLDERVAGDSLAMHGQIASPGSVFVMPEDPRAPEPMWGRTWDCPPNRPNDRSVCAPWRPHWGIWGWRWQGGQRVSQEE